MEVRRPKAIKEGPREELFGFLADRGATFLAKECGRNVEGDLDFSFSFPITQSAIIEGKFIVWNKVFSAKDCVGADLVQLWQEAFFCERYEPVKALANDTVGTMEAAAYSRPSTEVGAIIGTSTNAVNIERNPRMLENGEEHLVRRCLPCRPLVSSMASAMPLPMLDAAEWGNLDMKRIMNKFDMRVDSISNEPGAQTFEKMISGCNWESFFASQ
ncbi:hypothetical protein AB1Y20_012244 [Prymnesium parvum]|uniref:Phosphotransferase n=1 Tax=Prymnesium parvum TaxID=97485 RepID=A0AB34IMY4_PRYPA